MTEWRIKEISDLTQTSIRMLRHYDKIGLLKPSCRSANGYRCYRAEDLAKLQQIIALKYFGFSLDTIKLILGKHQNIYAHLQAQQQVVKSQSLHLERVQEALGNILNRLSPSQTPNWNDLITLIERYRMTETLRAKLKKSWAGQKLSEDQFEEFLAMYEQFPKEFAEREKILADINAGKIGDPAGPDGERVVLFMYDLANKTKKLYIKYMKFSSSLLSSIQSGKVTQLEVSPEGMLWISKATLAYWLNRWEALYEDIVKNLKTDPKSKTGKKIAMQWTQLIDEQLSMGSRTFGMGVMMWQELARQNHEIQALKKPPTLKEMVKQFHVKLFFNPDALSWINHALVAHTD